MTTWGGLLGTTDATPIRIVYRNGSSGTSEILTRHLNAVCPTKFTTNSTFVNARPVGSTLPSNWVGVASTADVAPTVAAVDGSLGYVGPDGVDATSNAVVARVNNVQPTSANVALALASVTPPSTAVLAADPTRWSPVVANPAIGYKLAAYTNLIVGQCYKDAAVANDVKAFLTTHYNTTNNDLAIKNHGFVTVPSAWKTKVYETFVSNATGYNLNINNTNVCNTIGRPQ